MNVQKWYIESEILLYSKELQNIIYNFFYDISGTFVSLFIKTNFLQETFLVLFFPAMDQATLSI